MTKAKIQPIHGMESKVLLPLDTTLAMLVDVKS